MYPIEHSQAHLSLYVTEYAHAPLSEAAYLSSQRVETRPFYRTGTALRQSARKETNRSRVGLSWPMLHWMTRITRP